MQEGAAYFPLAKRFSLFGFARARFARAYLTDGAKRATIYLYFPSILKEHGMADVSMKFDQVERLWLKKALENLEKSLQRSLSKELPGSDISQLRSREIQQVSQLRAKFG